MEKEIQTMKITKISFQEARQIVTDRTPKPGFSYSSALNSTTSPPVQTSLQTPEIQQTIENNTTSSSITNDDTITIKKSDFLALLDIKKSWEDISKSSVSKTTVSTLTDDKICGVDRPPKKKNSKVKAANKPIVNDATSSTSFSNSENTPSHFKPSLPSSFQLPAETMLTDSSIPDDSDTDNVIDYDPEETLEDFQRDTRARKPSSSQYQLSPKSLSKLISFSKKERRKKKS